MDGQRFHFLPEEIGLLDAELEPGYDNLTSLAADLLQVPVAVISVLQPNEERLFFKSFYGLGEPWRTNRDYPLKQSFCQHVQQAERPLVVFDAAVDPRVRELQAVNELGVSAYLGFPVCGPDGKTIGSFCVIDQKPRDWSDRDMDHVRKLASAMNDQILLRAALKAREQELDRLEQEVKARKQAEAELLRLATTDPLTGALNRRALTERAAAELARSQRYGHTLGVAVIDLDHFKRINDQHGHPVGDEVLKAVSDRLQSSVRDQIDILARIGGEEFCVLLPETDPKACVSAAERMRRQLEAHPLTGRIEITASIGVALRRDSDQDFHDILGRADAALYAAKDAGRNCVRVHDGHGPNVPGSGSTDSRSASHAAGHG